MSTWQKDSKISQSFDATCGYSDRCTLKNKVCLPHFGNHSLTMPLDSHYTEIRRFNEKRIYDVSPDIFFPTVLYHKGLIQGVCEFLKDDVRKAKFCESLYEKWNFNGNNRFNELTKFHLIMWTPMALGSAETERQVFPS